MLLGYERTTTRDIAADAGVNLALINRYFGGKRGLFEVVVERFSEMLPEPPADDRDIVGEFLASLADDAWPQFGTHPLVLLLRDDGSDDRIRQLRVEALGRVVSGLGPQPGDAPPAVPGSPEAAAFQVRLQLVVALFAGIVALRDVAGLEPIASTPPDALREALDDVLSALLGG